MRTPLLATVLGLSLEGCLTIGDSGYASPGDDNMGSGGSGTGLGSISGSGASPIVSVAMDRETVPTELGKSEVVTLSLTCVDAFAGNVSVASSLVDGAGAALTTGGLTVTGPASVTLTANGTATAMYTVKIPTDATATQFAANLKLDVASPVGNKTFTSAFTIAPTLTITYAAGLAGNVPMHPGTGVKFSIKKGAKISVHNADNAEHITHGDGPFPHETQTPGVGGVAGGTYVIDTAKIADTQIGKSGSVGCHTHNNVTYATVTLVQ
jgi:hypothetical protein